MHCPIDQEGLLSFTSQKPAIHTCPQCRGVWLPSLTMRKVFADHHLAGTKFGELIRGRLIREASPDRYCVTCRRTRLMVCKFGEIELDYCPKCNGVWLDDGELAALKRWHEGQKKSWVTQPSGLHNMTAGNSSNTVELIGAVGEGAFELVLHGIFEVLSGGL